MWQLVWTYIAELSPPGNCCFTLADHWELSMSHAVPQILTWKGGDWSGRKALVIKQYQQLLRRT